MDHPFRGRLTRRARPPLHAMRMAARLSRARGKGRHRMRGNGGPGGGMGERRRYPVARGGGGCLRGKREDIWGDPSRRIRAAWFMEGEQRQLAVRGGGWLVGDFARLGRLQGAVVGVLERGGAEGGVARGGEERYPVARGGWVCVEGFRTAWVLAGRGRGVLERGGAEMSKCGGSLQTRCVRPHERRAQRYMQRFVAGAGRRGIWGRGEGIPSRGAAGGSWGIPHGVGVCRARSRGA